MYTFEDPTFSGENSPLSSVQSFSCYSCKKMQVRASPTKDATRATSHMLYRGVTTNLSKGATTTVEHLQMPQQQ